MKEFPDLYNDPLFDRTRRTVIYFHGWLVNTVDKSVVAMRSAYAGFNVIAVDWSYYSVNPDYYETVRPQLKIVRLIKYFIRFSTIFRIFRFLKYLLIYCVYFWKKVSTSIFCILLATAWAVRQSGKFHAI